MNEGGEMPGRPRVQRRTFYLLGCERCGRFAAPPVRVEQPDFIATASEPLRCNDCGDVLLLVEGWIAPQTRMWQDRPGATWQHVAYAELLPDNDGRRVWVDA